MSYIDLGLPSGTLWAESNEAELYVIEDATEKFGNALPSKGQFEELLECTSRIWDEERHGMRFQSSINGAEIFLPAEGFFDNYNYVHRGNRSDGWYLSSSSVDFFASVLYFSKWWAFVALARTYYGDRYIVRLVKSK